jgi:hypothetical protein
MKLDPVETGAERVPPLPVGNGVGDVVAYPERVGGLSNKEADGFFAVRTLMYLLAAMHLVQGREPGADRLVAGCGSQTSSRRLLPSRRPAARSRPATAGRQSKLPEQAKRGALLPPGGRRRRGVGIRKAR